MDRAGIVLAHRMQHFVGVEPLDPLHDLFAHSEGQVIAGAPFIHLPRVPHAGGLAAVDLHDAVIGFKLCHNWPLCRVNARQ